MTNRHQAFIDALREKTFVVDETGTQHIKFIDVLAIHARIYLFPEVLAKGDGADPTDGEIKLQQARASIATTCRCYDCCRMRGEVA